MEQEFEQEKDSSTGTLGAVLYGDSAKPRPSEKDWVLLVRAIAIGDQLALHALYERAYRPVFTLGLRITASREAAEEITLDVFHDIWRKASGYDPCNGTVLGWIMNQARSRAIDRLRYEQRKKRVDPFPPESQPTDEQTQFHDLLEGRQRAEVLRRALSLLTPDERQAIETAFFGELSYVEAALRLNQPEGTIKTRIRSGLHKLRLALAAEERKA